MATRQSPKVLNDHELARTMRRVDGFVPLEMSETAHLKRARRQTLSRAYVSLSYLGIVSVFFFLSYLSVLLGISNELSYIIPRMLAALVVIVALMWLMITERIDWKMWAIGILGLFVFCYLIA